MIRLLLERFPLGDDRSRFLYNPGRFIQPVESPRYIQRGHDPFAGVSTTSRVIVVQGQVGSGKTSATLHWANRLTVNWRWINLQPDDDDPVTFWGRNARGFRDSLDTEPRWQEPTSYSALPDRHDRVGLLKKLEHDLVEPLVVVWDNFDCIRDLLLLRQFGRFVSLTPNQLRMVVITSEPHFLPLDEWRSAFDVDVDVVDVGNGSFSITEAANYLRSHRPQLSSLDALDIVRRIRRTPHALNELVSRLAHGQRIAQLIDAIDPYEAFETKSLHRHFFSSLPVLVQNFLVTTSVLDWLSPQACDLLSDRSDSKDILRSMRRLGIPHEVSGHADDWYSIEPSFREFLIDEFRRSNPARQEHVLKRAVSWYMTRGDEERALVLAAEVSDERFRLGVLWRAAPNMFATGAPELVDESLSELALSVADDQLQSVQVGAIVGNDDVSTGEFERLVKDTTLDEGILRDAFVSLACLEGQRGSNLVMAEYLRRAKTFQSRTGFTGALENLAPVIEQRLRRLTDEGHDPFAAYELALEAVSKTPLAPAAAPHTGLAFTLALQGHLTRAREELVRACDMWNVSGATDFPMTSEIFFTDALLQIEAGSLAVAEGLIETGRDYLKYRGLRMFDAWYLGLLAEIHLLRKTPAEGLEVVDSAHNPHGYRPFGVELRGWLAERLFQLALHAGDVARARHELELITSPTALSIATARLTLHGGDEGKAASLLVASGPSTVRREVERHLLLARCRIDTADTAIAEISHAIDCASGEPLAATFRKESQLTSMFHDPRLESRVPAFAPSPILSDKLRDATLSIRPQDENLIQLLRTELSLAQIATRLGCSSLEVKRRSKSILNALGLSTRYDLLRKSTPASNTTT